jgi:hypothetical protein
MSLKLPLAGGSSPVCLMLGNLEVFSVKTGEKEPMSDRDAAGIATLQPIAKDKLEEKLRQVIADVPKEGAFESRYTDRAERKAVHGRALIAAVLDALFEHTFDLLCVEPDGSALVEVGEIDPLSALAAVRRDFLHDKERLDNGFNAELVLKPASRGSVEVAPQIPARRKALLLGIFLISLWSKRDAQRFNSKKAVRAFVAQMLEVKEGSIKTHCSYLTNNHINQRFNKEEVDFYRELESQCQATTGGVSPFEQFLPAFSALCEQAYPRTISASSWG